MEAPILAPPDPSLPFILDTDASSVGSGAVLTQVLPEAVRVVAYHSRAFNKAERRYYVTRQKLLAVVSATRHFKYYLGGLHFTIRTDYSALQWLMSFREPEGQLARWIEGLQVYDFTMVHRPGIQHGNADALSHQPCAADDFHYCEKGEVQEREWLQVEARCAAVGIKKTPANRGLTSVDAAEWRRRQGEDSDLTPALSWVFEQRCPAWEDIGLCS